MGVMPADKAISAAGRNTLICSASFRLITILYFLVLKLAEDRE